jgi:hypothetical protein
MRTPVQCSRYVLITYLVTSVRGSSSCDEDPRMAQRRPSLMYWVMSPMLD